MKNKSDSAWWNVSWNPLVGCTEQSVGCQNCYSKALIHRFRGRKGWPESWGYPQANLEKMDEPLRWRDPKKVFVCSMSDLFHHLVGQHFVERVFEVIKYARWHEFFVLTKRSQKMRSFMTKFLKPYNDANILPNVFIGISGENQHWLDKRMNDLRQVNSVRKFVSLEPLLERVDVSMHLGDLDWVIVGCETGPGARPLDPDWIRHIVDQCFQGNTPVFVKRVFPRADNPRDLTVRQYPGEGEFAWQKR